MADVLMRVPHQHPRTLIREQLKDELKVTAGGTDANTASNREVYDMSRQVAAEL